MNDQLCLGMIRLWAGTFLPEGYAWCDGSLLQIGENQALFSVIGTNFGGDGVNTFGLPNMQSNIAVGIGQGPGLSTYNIGQSGGTPGWVLQQSELPAHKHSMMAVSGTANQPSPKNGSLATMQTNNGRATVNVPGYSASGGSFMDVGTLQNTGANNPHENLMPYQTLKYIICVNGMYGNTEGVVGQIMLFASSYRESYLGSGWLPCNGQSLNTQDYTDLFKVIGGTYGGGGGHFNLPNFQSRTMMGTGNSNSGNQVNIAQSFGVESYALKEAEIPAHSHLVQGSSGPGVSTNPVTHNLATGSTTPVFSPYSNAMPDVTLNQQAILPTGMGYPHSNIQPYLGLTYVICVDGIAPSSAGNSTDYIGMVAVSAGMQDGNYLPCNGARIPSDIPALISILGSNFDPAHQNNVVPDLRAAVPMGCANMDTDAPGSTGGTWMANIQPDQLPSHNHLLMVNNKDGDQTNPSGNFIASTPGSANPKGINIFGTPASYDGTILNRDVITKTGGSIPHYNIQPSIGVNFGICSKGLYPSPS